MSYELKDINITEDGVLITSVEYNINGVIVNVDIPHASPPDIDYVIESIKKRFVSEGNKIDSIAVCKGIKEELSKTINKIFDIK